MLSYSYLKNGIEKSCICSLDSTADDETLKALIRDNKLISIHSSEPNLGDIFMEITGRRLS